MSEKTLTELLQWYVPSSKNPGQDYEPHNLWEECSDEVEGLAENLGKLMVDKGLSYTVSDPEVAPEDGSTALTQSITLTKEGQYRVSVNLQYENAKHDATTETSGWHLIETFFSVTAISEAANERFTKLFDKTELYWDSANGDNSLPPVLHAVQETYGDVATIDIALKAYDN